MKLDADKIDWEKGGGLVPAVVQDAENGRVLMLAYMNRESLAQTLKTGKVTFFSRSKNALWTKGETTGHFLDFVSAEVDCDGDTILVQARPQGPACHLMTQTCFNDEAGAPVLFLKTLSALVKQRNKDRPAGSYTTKLFTEGRQRMAQKVGEEGVEIALAAATDDKTGIVSEAADMMFHLMVLLEDAGLSLDDVCATLKERHAK
jgi:phosphoribosyl-ATP pyrophosphohydrolase/phosphoribosyl-AMP cyclohydrolase